MAAGLLRWFTGPDRPAGQVLPLAPPIGVGGVWGVGLPLTAVAAVAANGLPAEAWPEALQRAVPARRQAFLAGRLAAELALAEAGCGGDVGIGIGARREPLWPAGWRGAITHHATWAGALVAPAARWAGVGLDVETLAQGEALAAIVSQCLTADERKRWAHGASDEVAWQATLIFSAKEALYKALQPEGPAWVDFTDVQALAITADEVLLAAVPGTEVAGVLTGDVRARWLRVGDDLHTQVLRPRG